MSVLGAVDNIVVIGYISVPVSSHSDSRCFDTLACKPTAPQGAFVTCVVVEPSMRSIHLFEAQDGKMPRGEKEKT